MIGVLLGVKARSGNGVNCFVGVLSCVGLAFLRGVDDFEEDFGVVECLFAWLLLRLKSRGLRARLGLPVSDAIEVAIWFGTAGVWVGVIASP